MKLFTAVIVCVAVITLTQSTDVAIGYRGIVPLKSSRADVERILGRSSQPDRSTYYMRDEIVIIQYSKYGCAQPPTVEGWPVPPLEGWKVPPDTVLAVRINLRRQVPVEALKLDLKSFTKKRGDRDVGTHFLYVNDEQGLTLDLNGEGDRDVVSALVYRPAAKYNHLRCTEEVIPDL